MKCEAIRVSYKMIGLLGPYKQGKQQKAFLAAKAVTEMLFCVAYQ